MHVTEQYMRYMTISIGVLYMVSPTQHAKQKEESGNQEHVPGYRQQTVRKQLMG